MICRVIEAILPSDTRLTPILLQAGDTGLLVDGHPAAVMSAYTGIA